MMHIRFFTIFLFIGISISGFSQTKIKLTDVVVDDIFKQITVSGFHSMNDGLNYSVSEDGRKISSYSYKTGQKLDVIFDLSKIENAGFTSFTEYAFSADETKILFTTEKKSIFRHSFTSEYFVWNGTTKEMSPLSVNGPQQLATFSPDGERIAFVRDNNIFIKSLKFGTEKSPATTWRAETGLRPA
jgi:dipeptidyl-peptidase-4